MDGSEVTQLGARPESAADAAYAELASHFVASVLKLAEENLAARPLTAPSRPITAAEASSAPGPAAGASQSRPNTVQSQAGASRPATSASYNPPSTAGSAADVSRPSTAVLKEVSVDAIEAALGSALKHLQQFGLVESEVPLQVEPALTLVAGIIQTWPISEQWKYHLRLSSAEAKALVIEAIFSIPTRRRPVPNATASVFFRLEKMEQEGQIQITYTVEAQRMIYSGNNVCRDKWLRDVLSNKRLIQEQFQL